MDKAEIGKILDKCINNQITDNQAVNQISSLIIKWLEGKRRPMYGGTLERATNLPPDIECANTGRNQLITELVEEIRE